MYHSTSGVLRRRAIIGPVCGPGGQSCEPAPKSTNQPGGRTTAYTASRCGWYRSEHHHDPTHDSPLTSYLLGMAREAWPITLIPPYGYTRV